MSTATESLTIAAAELRVTNVALQGLTTLATTQLAAKANAAQVAINNFLASSSKTYIVEPSGGVDTSDGLSINTTLRTLDGALDKIDADGSSIFGATILCLGDVSMTKFRQSRSPISIVGAEWGGGVLGAPYRRVLRNLTMPGEAMNSPFPGIGRTVPGLFVLPGSLRLQSITMTLPDAISALDNKVHFIMANGGSVIGDVFNILAATANTNAILFDTYAPANFGLSGSIGANVPGKIFRGIAAGANPNTNFYTRSNLTSA